VPNPSRVPIRQLGVQALADAGWGGARLSDAERNATGVAVGAGMSCTAELAAAALLLEDGTGSRHNQADECLSAVGSGTRHSGSSRVQSLTV
jgi:hypothetical protein